MPSCPTVIHEMIWFSEENQVVLTKVPNNLVGQDAILSYSYFVV